MYTTSRKTLTLTKSAVPICTPPAHPLPYCQFQTLAQPSPSAAHLTGKVKLTETLYWATSPGNSIQVGC